MNRMLWASFLLLGLLWGMSQAAQLNRAGQSMLGSTPTPPVWPSSYEVAYVISLPYTATVQPTAPLRYPVHIWWGGAGKGQLRMSFYDGLDDTFYTPEGMYYVYPRISKRSCLVVSSGTGPILLGSLLGEDELTPLPDISSWSYAGTAKLPGVGRANVWQSTVRFWEKVNTYTFFTSQDGRPLKLVMLGVNLFTGSHFDQYEVEFTAFGPLKNAADVFRPPALCDDAVHMSQTADQGLSHTLGYQATSLMPGAMVVSKGSHLGQAASLQQVLRSAWARLTGSGQAAAADAAVVSANLQLIKQWNSHVAVSKPAEPAAGPGPVAAQDVYKLDVNKFIGMSHDQWKATMLGHKPRKSGSLRSIRRSPAYLGQYQRQLPDDQLPKEVDWRGTGADGPVKDQASCGSCWAFATTGAMTGAWFKATGQALSFSEQQIVDCSWDYEVNGCWGGNVEPALEYLAAHGGAALEAAYPYLGQNSFCKENKTKSAAKFKGFKSVPTNDEHALMEAVALHGPVAISFDAVHPTFKYYSEGVYYREDCGHDLDHLNHAVVLVGYGTTPSGTDYWLLRNSWSQLWGDSGYFKMARKGNDCGVTLDAVLAVVDEKAAEKARAH